jgi:hypothetical protein
MNSNVKHIHFCVGHLLVTVTLLFARSASAESAVIFDNRGAVLGASGQPFTIFPFYVGAGWGSITPPSAAVRAHQAYLTNLAAFTSGTFVPPGIQPFIKQYRVVAGASVGPAAGDTTAPPRLLGSEDIKTIITNAQAKPPTDIGHLPPYASNVLIMVFPSTTFTPGPDVCAGGLTSGSYHCNAGPNKFFGVVFGSDTATGASDVNQVVSHEVFEAATDPGFPGNLAWDNLGPPNVEVCDSNLNPTFGYNGIKIWQCFDNSLGGQQTTTGYDPPIAFDPVSFLYPTIYPLF